MNRLGLVRIAMAMTQADLADVPQSSLSRMEKGEINLTSKSLVKVARALDVSIDYLLGLTDDPRPVIEGPAVTLKEWAIIQAMRKGDMALAIQMMMDEAK